MKLSARVGSVNFLLLVAVTWEIKILGGQRKEKRERKKGREGELVSSNEMKKRRGSDAFVY